MHDEDTFSDPTWPEYTQEDFEEVDRICKARGLQGSGIDNGAPSILIEVEGAADEDDDKSRAASESSRKSPYEIYRHRRRYLSVSDIVSLAWCEVQFDYGLRQHRFKPVEQRPEKFFTRKGKEIHVKVKVAKKNDRVMKKGKVVHQKLEREIHKEEVVIQHTSNEERWALRLLDFVTRLKIGKDGLVCREIPVWGIINGHAIFGVIDELHLEVNEKSPTNSTQRKAHIDVSQTKMDTFIKTQKQPLKTFPPKPPFTLHILDNKTRSSQLMPLHVDTLPSRLQLMLYQRMLRQVLAVSANEPHFSLFCAQVGRDLKRAFSDAFITEISQLVIQNGLNLHFLDVKCLEDMDFPLAESIKEMELDSEDCVSSQLTLVYRLRGDKSKRSKLSIDSSNKVKLSPNSVNSPNITVIKEIPGNPDDVQESELSSLKVMPLVDGSVDVNLSENVVGLTSESTMLIADAPNMDSSSAVSVIDFKSPHKRKRDSDFAPSTKKSDPVSEPSSDSNDDEGGATGGSTRSKTSKDSSSFILGRKKFQYNINLLDAHLSTALAWWDGKRPPRGVSVEDTGRCNSCEYKDGCEWREQKALEIMEKAPALEVPKAKSGSASFGRASA